MKFYKTATPILFFILITISSCIKSGGNCEEAYDVKQSEIVIDFKDKTTGRYLYEETNPLYLKNDLRVYDPNGKSLIVLSSLNQIPGSLNKYWRVSFGNIYDHTTDEGSFNAEICKEFTIKYNQSETDIIKACFKSEKTACGSVFKTLKVYHNGILTGTTNNETYILVTVIKN